jgi:hypothetical protein
LFKKMSADELSKMTAELAICEARYADLNEQVQAKYEAWMEAIIAKIDESKKHQEYRLAQQNFGSFLPVLNAKLRELCALRERLAGGGESKGPAGGGESKGPAGGGESEEFRISLRL